MKKIKQNPTKVREYYNYDIIYFKEQLENLLNEKAKEGLFIKEITGKMIFSNKRKFTFIKGEPANLKFSVDYFKAEYNQSEKDYIQICQDSGWDLAYKNWDLYIFSSKEENPTPIQSDLSIQINMITQTKKDIIQRLIGLILISPIFFLIIYFYKYYNLISFYYIKLYFILFFIIIPFILLLISNIKLIYHLTKKIKNHNYLLPIKKCKRRNKSEIAIYAFFSLILIFRLILAPSNHLNFHDYSQLKNGEYIDKLNPDEYIYDYNNRSNAFTESSFPSLLINNWYFYHIESQGFSFHVYKVTTPIKFIQDDLYNNIERENFIISTLKSEDYSLISEQNLKRLNVDRGLILYEQNHISSLNTTILKLQKNNTIYLFMINHILSESEFDILKEYMENDEK